MIGIVATAFVATPARSTTVFAASGSIAVTPATQPVPAGSTFTVTLTQSAAGATTGAEATVTFDPSIVQIQAIQPGSAYASATLLFGRVPGSDTGQAGQPQTPEEAVAEANQTGILANATTFLNPGTGSVAGGDNPFLVLTMIAVAAGTSPISLSKMEMLDDQYTGLDVAGADGTVVVGGAGAPPPATIAAPPTGATGSTPAAATTAAASPAAGVTAPAKTAASGGVAGLSKAPSLKSAAFAVAPATQTVAKDSTFTFAVTHTLDGAASNAQADVTFKKDIVEIVKLEPGSGWKADSKALTAAMADANNNGELKVTLTADKDKGPATSGEATLLTVTMHGRTGKEGKSSIKLVSTEITGSDGSSVPLSVADGEVIVGSAGGGSSTLLIVIVVVAAVIVLGGGGAAFAMKRARGS